MPIRAAARDTLSELHLEGLAHLAPAMHTLWDALEHAGDGAGNAHPASPPRDA